MTTAALAKVTDPLRFGRLSTRKAGGSASGLRPRTLGPVSPSASSSMGQSSSSPALMWTGDATMTADEVPPPPFQAFMTQRRPDAIRLDGKPRWQGGVLMPPPPELRVRSLICNWPAHYCKESLIIINDDMPVKPPYRLRVKCDVRRRQTELQNGKKTAYLVAFDSDRLRTFGSGMGIDALEASNSFLSRDCLCSDLCPIVNFRSEVEIQLRPPDNSDGDVLIILRVVKCGNLRDMQDWFPIGDPVVVRAMPQKVRSDKGCIHRLHLELEASRALASSTHEALEKSHDELHESLEVVAKVKASLAHSKLELNNSQEDARQLHCEVDAVSEEMEAGKAATTEANAASALRGALQKSRGRQAESSEAAAATSQKAFAESEAELEASYTAMGQTTADLDRMHQHVEAVSKTGSEAQAVLLIRSHQNQKRVAQLRATQESTKKLQAALEQAQKDAEAHRDSATDMQAQVDQAKAEAIEERNKHFAVRSELEEKKFAASQALLKASLGGGAGLEALTIGLSSGEAGQIDWLAKQDAASKPEIDKGDQSGSQASTAYPSRAATPSDGATRPSSTAAKDIPRVQIAEIQASDSKPSPKVVRTKSSLQGSMKKDPGGGLYGSMKKADRCILTGE